MRYPKSDHCDGSLFFNPGVDTDRSMRQFLAWQLTGHWDHWPKHRDNPPVPPPQPFRGDGIAATFVGHSTVLLQAAGRTYLTDPIFSDRAGPFGVAGPRRVREPGIGFDEIPPVDVVLLSHNHYDHMDIPTLQRLQERDRPLIVTGLGNGRLLARRGIRKAVELDWWDETNPFGDVTVTYVPAQHWSRRGLADTRRNLWGGHVVETPAGRIYFAGDAAYSAHFRAIRERLGRPDLALLPIGAYEPRWFMQAQHMNPEDAVRAHLDLEPALSIAIHFGTFQLTDEGIDAPPRALAEARRAFRVPDEAFRLPGFGETIVWQREVVAKARRAPAGS